MGKRSKTDKYRLIEHRGTGRGENYKPWLRVGEVQGSFSRSHRPYSFKTKREHHLLSDLELYYFLLMEWDDNVKEIREQYPLLPILKTQLIATQMGYRHPTPPGTTTPIVMTTDFIITRKIDGIYVDEAIAIKTEADLSKPRTREKMAIERQFWIEKGIRWKVVTDTNIPIQKAKNLKRIFNIEENSEVKMVKGDMVHLLFNDISEIFYLNPNLEHDLVYICQLFDKNYNLKPGVGIKLLMYLIRFKNIVVDLDYPLNFKKLKIIKAVKTC